jgi:hypothetical protein
MSLLQLSAAAFGSRAFAQEKSLGGMIFRARLADLSTDKSRKAGASTDFTHENERFCAALFAIIA